MGIRVSRSFFLCLSCSLSHSRGVFTAPVFVLETRGRVCVCVCIHALECDPYVVRALLQLAPGPHLKTTHMFQLTQTLPADRSVRYRHLASFASVTSSGHPHG